jgi:hypothetical protein
MISGALSFDTYSLEYQWYLVDEGPEFIKARRARVMEEGHEQRREFYCWHNEKEEISSVNEENVLEEEKT